MLKISDDIFIIKKISIARCLFYAGILTAYWGALMPWFVWKIENYYFILSAMLIILSMMVAQKLPTPLFCRKDYQLPIISYLALTVMMKIVNGNNINSYISIFFYATIFLSIFLISTDEIKKLMKFLCVVMASLLCISIPFFILYIIGFPLPSSPIVHEELMYSYTNYYFFMIDDRSFFILIPRFHSVFMEPGHLGTASVLLLLTQLGNWKKWYNIVLLIGTIMTFSLAAFVLLALVLFVNAWLKHKKILPKIIFIIAFLSSIAIGATFYNDGDNMVNTLILERLQINDDGKLSGDNRVTDSFQAEFNDFIKTEDILFGREYVLAEFGWGNAGYKVFLYDNGIVCLILVIILYFCAVASSKNGRAIIAMFVIGSATFWVRAIPLSFYFFIPMYAFAYIGINENKEIENIKKETDEQ